MKISTGKDLGAIRAAATATLNAAAEKARMLHVTPGSGMAQVYSAKLDEAARLLALSADGQSQATAGDYPFLSAEAQARGCAMAQVAQLVQAAAATSAAALASIEGRRIAAKLAIAAAAAEVDVDTAIVVSFS